MENGIEIVEFNIGEDTRELYYLISDDPGLDFKDLGNTNKLRYKDVLRTWENFCMNYALKTTALTTKFTTISHGDIALCIPIGGTEEHPIYGELMHLICKDGEFVTLEYYYPKEY